MKDNDRSRILWFGYFAVLLLAEKWLRTYSYMNIGAASVVVNVLRIHFAVHSILSQWYLAAQYQAAKRGTTPKRFSWQPLDTWYSVMFVPKSDRGCRWYLFGTVVCMTGLICLFVSQMLG